MLKPGNTVAELETIVVAIELETIVVTVELKTIVVAVELETTGGGTIALQVAGIAAELDATAVIVKLNFKSETGDCDEIITVEHLDEEK